jgi:ankyrin repeat protein
LFDANPDSSHTAKDGTTALKRASGSGHINLVELLEADIRLRAELG